jgi:hypothetical protein
MPLLIASGFFFVIAGLVVLGSHLLGPDNWLSRSDPDPIRAQADAEQLRQRLRSAMLGG